MDIQSKPAECEGVRFSIVEEGIEVAHAYLYLMTNDLHQRPFGLLEDVFVDEEYRGKGYGTRLVREVMAVAREKSCYKLLATSRRERPKVHEMYVRLGFEDYGKEFRMNFE